jgi:hypothetical protein
MSSHNPTKPIATAGPSSEVASQKFLNVKSDISSVPYVIVTIPIIIATPPKYGIGCL